MNALVGAHCKRAFVFRRSSNRHSWISILQVAPHGASRQNIRQNTHFWFSLPQPGTGHLGRMLTFAASEFACRKKKRVVDKFHKSLCTQRHGSYWTEFQNGRWLFTALLPISKWSNIDRLCLFVVCVLLSLCLFVCFCVYSYSSLLWLFSATLYNYREF